LGNSSRIYYSVTPPKSLCYVKGFCLPHESKIKRQSFFSTLYFPKLGLVSRAEFGSQCFFPGYHQPLIINAPEEKAPFSPALLLVVLKCTQLMPVMMQDGGAVCPTEPWAKGRGEEPRAAAGNALVFSQSGTKRSPNQLPKLS
jgi:hypothetical protein